MILLAAIVALQPPGNLDFAFRKHLKTVLISVNPRDIATQRQIKKILRRHHIHMLFGTLSLQLNLGVSGDPNQIVRWMHAEAPEKQYHFCVSYKSREMRAF